MTLDIAVFASILLVVVTGGTIGVGLLVLGLQDRHGKNLASALRIQEEAYKVELRELDRYNAEERRRLEEQIAALEKKVSDLEAKRAGDWEMLRVVLAERGISMPKAGPVYNVAGDLNAAGDLVAGGKAAR